MIQKGQLNQFSINQNQSGINGHPFDDLSIEEIEKVVSIIKNENDLSEDLNFVYMLTNEPKKKIYLDAKNSSKEDRPKNLNDIIPRQAFVLLYDKKKSKTWKVIVDIQKGKILSKIHLTHMFPPIMDIDYEIVPDIINKDPRWIESLRKRGITNLEDVYLDVWAPGLMSADELKKPRRMIRIIPFFQGKDKNIYARPIEGLIATVDLDQEEVVSVWNTEIVSYASKGRNFDEDSNGPLRRVKPLIVSQPQGPNFVVRGQEISWQNWVFRYSMQPMKGLVLYDIRYIDGEARSILYKAGVSEMVVPYAEPGKNWTFRSAFDVGEYGLGMTSHPMVPKIDLPENAVYFDAHFVDNKGGPFVIKNAIGLYERDGGRLWKHYDTTTEISEVRRGQELVLTSMTTIGNYDYAFNWIFHQDGTLEVQVELTGIVLTKGTSIKRNVCDKECNLLVSPHIQAPHHQHYFSFRLDFDVDGTNNIPLEVNMESIAMGKKNPVGNVYQKKQTLLSREKSGMRSMDMSKSRMWKIISGDKKNELGHPTGYGLIPGENSIPYLHPMAVVRQRAGFLNHHIWLTRYHDDEQSAAGEFPNQSQFRFSKLNHPSIEGEGLPQWIKNNESLEKEDIVMWYTLGVTHHTRPEDWPVMPVHRTGFKLVPINFFIQNPAMNVPNVK